MTTEKPVTKEMISQRIKRNELALTFLSQQVEKREKETLRGKLRRFVRKFHVIGLLHVGAFFGVPLMFAKLIGPFPLDGIVTMALLGAIVVSGVGRLARLGQSRNLGGKKQKKLANAIEQNTRQLQKQESEIPSPPPDWTRGEAELKARTARQREELAHISQKLQNPTLDEFDWLYCSDRWLSNWGRRERSEEVTTDCEQIITQVCAALGQEMPPTWQGQAVMFLDRIISACVDQRLGIHDSMFRDIQNLEGKIEPKTYWKFLETAFQGRREYSAKFCLDLSSRMPPDTALQILEYIYREHSDDMFQRENVIGNAPQHIERLIAEERYGEAKKAVEKWLPRAQRHYPEAASRMMDFMRPIAEDLAQKLLPKAEVPEELVSIAAVRLTQLQRG